MMLNNFEQDKRVDKPKHIKASYVANDILEEIQIDLADFTKSAEVNNGYRYAFVAIDIFSKIIHAIPIKDKMPK